MDANNPHYYRIWIDLTGGYRPMVYQTLREAAKAAREAHATFLGDLHRVRVFEFDASRPGQPDGHKEVMCLQNRH